MATLIHRQSPSVSQNLPRSGDLLDCDLVDQRDVHSIVWETAAWLEEDYRRKAVGIGDGLYSIWLEPRHATRGYRCQMHQFISQYALRLCTIECA